MTLLKLLAEHRGLFSVKIAFSDEAQFLLDGFVNKQTSRIFEDGSTSQKTCQNIHRL